MRLMSRLTGRQRRAWAILAMANLIALSALGFFLVRAAPSHDEASVAPFMDPLRVKACRDSVSGALFRSGHSGMVQTHKDGTITVNLQRSPDAHSPRLGADAAIWTALEAVAAGDCVDFDALQITVLLVTPNPAAEGPRKPAVADEVLTNANSTYGDTARASDQGSLASARLRFADLMTWSLGEIDDAELTLRIDYQPPTTLPPVSPETTTDP